MEEGARLTLSSSSKLGHHPPRPPSPPRSPSPFILTSWNPSVLPACPWLSSKDPEGFVVGRLRGAGADAGTGRTGCVAGGTQDVTQATGRS